MPKAEKVEAVKQIAKRFKDADGALLTEYRGLKVEEMKELRRALSDAGTDFKVVKNSLTRLAVKDAKLEDLLPFLEGSTAIAFIKGDPVEAAKGLDEMARKYPSLVVKGGIVEGKVLDATQASSLAKVKPREVLLAQLAGMMQQPLQQVANLLTAPVRSLAYALGAYRDKAEQASPAQTVEEAMPEETPKQVVEEAPPDQAVEDVLPDESPEQEAEETTPPVAESEPAVPEQSETPTTQDEGPTETEELANQGEEEKEE